MSPPPAATRARLDAYLGEIAARLHGPSRRRARILTELRDGLDEAVADQITAGLPAEDAVAVAIARFGTPAAVADAFAAELTIAYARRVLAWFVATGPMVGIWWLFLLHPAPQRGGLIALIAAIPVVPLAAAGLAAAAITFATTGRMMRWLPEASASRAAATVLAVAGLVVVGDVTIVGVYLCSGAPVQPLGLVAVTASLIRIGVSLLTVRRATALRRRVMVPDRSPVGRDARR
ncbi:permease prefix domain 1-containing protein [Actinoplanes sp. ATCC 53533]|uniref:permease prefix domain 1-containing protein n=1 Tax=Actinoplanes sp. ATCC 53533 TaxID=1288362 RepID=UPI000F78DA0C|nr:permease prefix domain 1-containing protein [Actinoplanes sp. ATCC 53533]